MNCGQARLRLGAEPDALDAGLRDHLARCPECRAFREEMQCLERDVRRVLAPIPASMGAPAWSPRRLLPRPGVPSWALAASVACVALAAALLWGLRPVPALARDVVAHVEGEPQSWSSTVVLPRAQVEQILWQDAGVKLAASADVVYARSCPFHGRHVPHLVVRTASGPVTVMVLRDERVPRAERFAIQGYSGILLPEPRGTIAVLERGAVDPARIAEQISRALGGMN